jgi:protein-S-isoprenylcysteine O-methyltransferase Ste14
MRTLETKIPPPIVMVLLGVLAWLGARHLPALTFHLPLDLALAVAVAAPGLFLNILPKVAFWRARTTVNPLRPGSVSHLVTSGVFRYSRNPMYLGHAVILFGWTIYLQNIAGFAAVPAFVLYVSRFQIGPEERHLYARFADEYTAFCRRTPRWL